MEMGRLIAGLHLDGDPFLRKSHYLDKQNQERRLDI